MHADKIHGKPGSRCMVLAVVGTLMGMGAMSIEAQAQIGAPDDTCQTTAGYPCKYDIADKQIQKVPSHFKFQSRISQAKLPVGDVVFRTVYVNVRVGDSPKCSEVFNNITVRDSVLNLEIGRNMKGCVLEDVIANNEDASFQICIGDEQNCLKPVSLSSVPFAMKSSYAYQAQKSSFANEAVQAHYAHRITADTDLFTAQKIGTGFYDFQTPKTTSDMNDLLEDFPSISVPWQNAMKDGGFIQWVQMDSKDTTNLHICGKFVTYDGKLAPLDYIVMHAENTHVMGKMVIEGDPDYNVESAGWDENMTPALTVERGAHVKGKTNLDGDVDVGTEAGTGGVMNVYNQSQLYDNVQIGREDDLFPSSEDPDILTSNYQMDVYHKAIFHAGAQFGEGAIVEHDHDERYSRLDHEHDYVERSSLISLNNLVESKFVKFKSYEIPHGTWFLHTSNIILTTVELSQLGVDSCDRILQIHGRLIDNQHGSALSKEYSYTGAMKDIWGSGLFENSVHISCREKYEDVNQQVLDETYISVMVESFEDFDLSKEFGTLQLFAMILK